MRKKVILPARPEQRGIGIATTIGAGKPCRSAGILGIDASNIRAGGGVTHLVELLRAARPESYGFGRVIVWGGSETLSQLEDRNWLSKASDPLLNRALPYRSFWQRFKLKRLAEAAGCSVLFVPGGSDTSGFKPMVTMCQNLLPFEWRELRRYGLSWMSLKLGLLRFTQSRTFRKADAVIFLTQFSRDAVLRVLGVLSGKIAVIPHGVDPRFFCAPRLQRKPDEFSAVNPCRILYVSAVDVYKHQWHVIEAVAKLRASGLHVALDLVGPPASGFARLQAALSRFDPSGKFISYQDAVPYVELHDRYASADIGVFASTCETFGQILTEAMASGLPMACSNRSAMPGILGEAGVYFDPENPNSIAASIRRLIDSPELRTKMSQAAYERARQFSWSRCADETFALISHLTGAGSHDAR